MQHLIRSIFFLFFNTRLLLEREKTAKRFYFTLSLLSMGGFWQKLENVVKTSNGTGLKLFTLNQDIDEINYCKEQPGVTFPVYFVKVIHQREVIENFAESVQC